jgi:hypothetical protein
MDTHNDDLKTPLPVLSFLNLAVLEEHHACANVPNIERSGMQYQSCEQYCADTLAEVSGWLSRDARSKLRLIVEDSKANTSLNWTPVQSLVRRYRGSTT